MAATSERRYHHGNLRAALLEAAEAALARGGADALSLREVAREVGVSHAAPRRHFADRRALLDALAVDGFGRLGREMDEAIESAGDSFSERFAALGRAYFRFATEQAALLGVMYDSKHGSDEVRAAAESAFVAPLEMIARGQGSGEVVPGEITRLATIVWASLHGLATMANNGMLGDASPAEVLDDAVKRLLDGLRPR